MNIKLVFTATLVGGRRVGFRSNQPGQPIHTRINGFIATDEDILAAVKRLQEDKTDLIAVEEMPDGSFNYIVDRIYEVTPEGRKAAEAFEQEDDDDDEPRYWWQKGQYE